MDKPSNPTFDIRLKVSRADFDHLHVVACLCEGLSLEVDRYEWRSGDHPFSAEWRRAIYISHGMNRFADALLARAYLDAIGVEWIPIWDMSEIGTREIEGHCTLYLSPEVDEGLVLHANAFDRA